MPEVVQIPTAHVVLRPFRGAGRDLAAGEIVDASEWRTAKRLEDARYIAPWFGSAVDSQDGRRWRSTKYAVAAGATPKPQRQRKKG